MRPKFAPGQKVRFNKRCVLSPNVPKNSRHYTHTALVLVEGDEYEGSGVIPEGALATVVEYASHGVGSSDNPLVRVQGVMAACHQHHLDAD